MQHVLDQGQVVLYQTLLNNEGAVRIASRLGCTLYATTIYVSLTDTG